MTDIETHPFEPWLPENAKLLMCGTFPPSPQRWSMEFYYPNFINDMWRILGLIFHSDVSHFVDSAKKGFRLEEIKQMLNEKGIAIYDTGYRVRRLKGNASDKFLEIVTPVDFGKIISAIPECRAIVSTGQKAAEVIAACTASKVPSVGSYVPVNISMPDASLKPLLHFRMPSSSRAYPLKLEKKAEIYASMFKQLQIT